MAVDATAEVDSKFFSPFTVDSYPCESNKPMPLRLQCSHLSNQCFVVSAGPLRKAVHPLLNRTGPFMWSVFPS